MTDSLLERITGKESDAMRLCDPVLAFMEANEIKELTLRIGETTRKGRGTRAVWHTPISIECRGTKKEGK